MNHQIEFQAEGHIYRVNGKVTKSVTQILEAEGLTKYWNRDEWYMERGKAIHSGTVMIDKGTLNWDKVDERILGYLEAYKSFIEQAKWVFDHIEERLYHPLYQYCGTPDRFNDKGMLLDVKCGESFSLQLEGYGELLRANGYLIGREAYTLNLKETGKYRLDTYKFNKTDRGVFLSAVILNQYKRREDGTM